MKFETGVSEVGELSSCHAKHEKGKASASKSFVGRAKLRRAAALLIKSDLMTNDMGRRNIEIRMRRLKE